ncbi:methyltransferase domain-containing protein [Rhizobiales bacterium]|uniref:class I SAM-dependent methyltransferase n=1 Tax=Hongsoonwoonella zoysiae TaxID=2821844 RepID=UPI001560AEA7|nr:methyltransferase domain-containing protein [Hongsoonwoonella zoysiae]NRG19139.1 methyltransferase domain-containing protein [Hongsoonwoonella zoysiae]
MTRDAFQLTADAAAIYEEQKVSSIFGPLARATLDRIPVAPDDRVLDVACGTGIVVRTILDRFGPVTRIVGIDLNEGMIEHARSITKDLQGRLEWHVGDVQKLPFDDCSFTLVICQQGLQFFPDGEAALKEMRRVTEPGGKLLLTIWAGTSPFFKALARALHKHVSADVARRSVSPFDHDVGQMLPGMLARCGYSKPEIETIAIDRVIKDPQRGIPKEIMGNPIGPSVAERGDAVMQRIVDDVIAECAAYRQGEALVVPQCATMIAAKAV